MTEPLGPETLKWLRDHLRLGDKFVFAEMEAVTQRIKKERQLQKRPQ